MFNFLAAAVLFTLMLWESQKRNADALFLMEADDSDMKIVGVYPGSHAAPAESGADESARIFLAHKENGNMERAKKLGTLYGEWLVNESNPIVEFNLCKDEQEACYQRYLLCAYVITMTVSENAPDRILSNAVTASFYEFLRDNSPRLYEDITDSAAFSLYILRARTHRFVDEAMGRVFAVLCAHDDEPEYIEIGRRIYAQCSAQCANMLAAAGFLPLGAD